MNKKLIAIFAVMLIFLCCVSVASADVENGTGDTDSAGQKQVNSEPAPTETEPTEIDLSQYITVLSIANGVAQFSDGFTGYSLDSSKQEATSHDGFESSGTGSAGSLSNYLKLAVVEAYRTNRQGDLNSIIASFVDGSYKSSSDPVIQAVLSSDETISDNAVVKIDNTTEATFNFEILTPVNGDTSSYFAYSVNMKTVEAGPLSSAPGDDENQTLSAQDNQTDKNQTLAAPDTDKNNTDDGKLKNSDKNTEKNDAKNGTQQDTSAVNQTNKTVENRTNTTIVNQKNTTIINQHNVRTVDNTQKEPTPQEHIMRAVGKPIFVLIAVFVLGSAVVIALRRRD